MNPYRRQTRSCKTQANINKYLENLNRFEEFILLIEDEIYLLEYHKFPIEIKTFDSDFFSIQPIDYLFGTQLISENIDYIKYTLEDMIDTDIYDDYFSYYRNAA